MKPLPRNVAVDRPCDVHFIEAWCYGKNEVRHCKEWANVQKVNRRGIRVMDCPHDCAVGADEIGDKCCLKKY